MNFERTELQESFRPFKISVSIETQEELNALWDMFKLNITIPNFVSTHNNLAPKDRDIIKNFMIDFGSAMGKITK